MKNSLWQITKYLVQDISGSIFRRDNIFAKNIRQLIDEKALQIHTRSNLNYEDIYKEIYAQLAEYTGISIETIKLIITGKAVPKFTERNLLCQYFALPERLVRTYKFYDNSAAPAFEELRDKTKAH